QTCALPISPGPEAHVGLPSGPGCKRTESRSRGICTGRHRFLGVPADNPGEPPHATAAVALGPRLAGPSVQRGNGGRPRGPRPQRSGPGCAVTALPHKTMAEMPTGQPDPSSRSRPFAPDPGGDGADFLGLDQDFGPQGAAWETEPADSFEFDGDLDGELDGAEGAYDDSVFAQDAPQIVDDGTEEGAWAGEAWDGEAAE